MRVLLVDNYPFPHQCILIFHFKDQYVEYRYHLKLGMSMAVSVSQYTTKCSDFCA